MKPQANDIQLQRYSDVRSQRPIPFSDFAIVFMHLIVHVLIGLFFEKYLCHDFLVIVTVLLLWLICEHMFIVYHLWFVRL